MLKRRTLLETQYCVIVNKKHWYKNTTKFIQGFIYQNKSVNIFLSPFSYCETTVYQSPVHTLIWTLSVHQPRGMSVVLIWTSNLSVWVAMMILYNETIQDTAVSRDQWGCWTVRTHNVLDMVTALWIWSPGSVRREAWDARIYQQVFSHPFLSQFLEGAGGKLSVHFSPLAKLFSLCLMKMTGTSVSVKHRPALILNTRPFLIFSIISSLLQWIKECLWNIFCI